METAKEILIKKAIEKNVSFLPGQILFITQIMNEFAIKTHADAIKNDKKICLLNCSNCNSEYIGPQPEYCCSGIECGCLGMPAEPIACSDECYNKILNNP